MTDLAAISGKIDGIASEVGEVKRKVGLIDQGINGGNGAVGLASQVGSHEKFIRENRPMIVIGRIFTYAGIGAIASAVTIFILRDPLLKFIGGG